MKRTSIVKKMVLCLAVVVVSLLLFSAASKAKEFNDTKRTEEEILSMSERELLAFLENNGVSIPDGTADNSEWGTFAKNIAGLVINNPKVSFHFNYTFAFQFANDIKNCIDRVLERPTLSSNESNRYNLLYSTVYGGWTNAYLDYNCYSFVLNITSDPYNPGAFSNHSYSTLPALSTLAQYTMEDLDARGFHCSRQYTSDPHSSLPSGKSVICLRRTSSSWNDYHFMRWESNYWRHKPGNTNILLYNYSNASYMTYWTDEYSMYDVEHACNTVYSSNVAYIAYASDHTWAYSSVIGGYYCTFCGYSDVE